MTVKELLKGVVEGTSDVATDVMGVVTKIVKEGTHDIGELFGAVIELGKEGVVDVETGVKDVYIGAVKALEASGETTEDAIQKVTVQAEKAVGNISQEAAGAVGEAAKKGLEEAKGIVKQPFEKVE